MKNTLLLHYITLHYLSSRPVPQDVLAEKRREIHGQLEKKREELKMLEKLQEAQLVIPAQEEKMARQEEEINELKKEMARKEKEAGKSIYLLQKKLKEVEGEERERERERERRKERITKSTKEIERNIAASDSKSSLSGKITFGVMTVMTVYSTCPLSSLL